MLLTQKQIEQITFGALEIYRDQNDIYRFKRLTDYQAKEFDSEHVEFGVEVAATAGVRFDFYTDSEFISIKFAGVMPGSATRFWYSFDLYINGKLSQTVLKDGYDVVDGEIYAKLYGKNNRIQLFFPCLANGGIQSVELSDGAVATPFTPKYKWLALGDSITQGFDAKMSSCTYANIVARELDAEIINQAIGGAKFQKEQLEYTGEYDFITVAYGTNDWYSFSSFEQLTEHCDDYFKTLSQIYPNTKKLAILPIWRKHWYNKKPTGDFFVCRTAIADIAKKYGIIPLESIDYVTHDSLFFKDLTLHPNDLGFVVYAKNLLKDLKELI